MNGIFLFHTFSREVKYDTTSIELTDFQSEERVKQHTGTRLVRRMASATDHRAFARCTMGKLLYQVCWLVD